MLRSPQKCTLTSWSRLAWPCGCVIRRRVPRAVAKGSPSGQPSRRRIERRRMSSMGSEALFASATTEALRLGIWDID